MYFLFFIIKQLADPIINCLLLYIVSARTMYLKAMYLKVLLYIPDKFNYLDCSIAKAHTSSPYRRKVCWQVRIGWPLRHRLFSPSSSNAKWGQFCFEVNLKFFINNVWLFVFLSAWFHRRMSFPIEILLHVSKQQHWLASLIYPPSSSNAKWGQFCF